MSAEEFDLTEIKNIKEFAAKLLDIPELLYKITVTNGAQLAYDSLKDVPVEQIKSSFYATRDFEGDAISIAREEGVELHDAEFDRLITYLRDVDNELRVLFDEKFGFTSTPTIN